MFVNHRRLGPRRQCEKSGQLLLRRGSGLGRGEPGAVHLAQLFQYGAIETDLPPTTYYTYRLPLGGFSHFGHGKEQRQENGKITAHWPERRGGVT